MGFMPHEQLKRNQGIKRYTILQETEVTEYPGGQKYVKVLWSKINDKDVQMANKASTIRKAEKSAIIKAKEVAEKKEKIEKERYINEGSIDL